MAGGGGGQAAAGEQAERQPDGVGSHLLRPRRGIAWPMPFRSASLAVPVVILLGSCAPPLPAVVTPVLSTPVAARAELPAFDVVGIASWYGPGFAGRRTASGDIFDPNQLTAAHRTLPFGTHVKVTNMDNGRTVVVRINDRGPFKAGRIIDLSRAAAERIGMLGSGTVRVMIEPLQAGASEVRVAAHETLRRFEVIARDRRRGELLLLTSPRGGPLMVRVVGTQLSDVSVDMLVSPELLAELGDGISVQASSADASP